MPLPLIPVLLGGAALATAAFGAKKGYDGYQDQEKAEEYLKDAETSFKHASEGLREIQEKTQEAFGIFGEQKQKVLDGNLKRFISLVDQFNTDYKTDNSREDIEHLSFNYQRFQGIKSEILNIQTAIEGLLASAGSGALAGFGAYGGVGLLASASTGTAISSLSGVAATNATLAWFGGGSLAAGGLGVAGGACVLGSVIAAPVIAIAGLYFSNEAEKAKSKAKSYYDDNNSVIKIILEEISRWECIYNRCAESVNKLEELDRIFGDKITIVLGAFGVFGPELSSWSQHAQKEFKTMVEIAETICNIINNPLMSDEDRITQEIIAYQKERQDLMVKIKKKYSA